MRWTSTPSSRRWTCRRGQVRRRTRVLASQLPSRLLLMMTRRSNRRNFQHGFKPCGRSRHRSRRLSSEQPALPREAGGPLLGLEGVLPAVPGAFLPSGHPESHAMRLEVSEQQRSQARLLDELLEAETRPLPMRTASNVAGSRVLRWLIAAVLLGCVGLGLTFNANSFVMPAGVPTEANAAVQVVQNSGTGLGSPRCF